MPKPKIHYVYMNGLSGYMPDNVGCVLTEEDAIESLMETFSDLDDGLPEGESELQVMRESLEEDSIYYFDHPETAGAQYCSIDICPNGEDCEDLECPDCLNVKCKCEEDEE